MQSTGTVYVRKRSLPARVIIGLCLTVVSVVLLAIPGGFVLPMMAAAPFAYLMPTPCFNFLAGPIVLVLFGLAALSSLLLIAVGITAIVLIAIQARGGLTMGVVFNVIVATLFLMFPFSFTPGEFSSHSELVAAGAFYSSFALLPLIATMLFLAPSFYRSRRTFIATLIAFGLLLTPGAIGLAKFGLQAAGVDTSPAQPFTSAAQTAHC
jgi:hypothetical protein